nr:hypothetical protein [Tanacetum cinerariifolium]
MFATLNNIKFTYYPSRHFTHNYARLHPNSKMKVYSKHIDWGQVKVTKDIMEGAIKARQVDDLDTLDLEKRIKKLEEDFGWLLEAKKAKEAKKSKKAKKKELKPKEVNKAKEAELKAKEAKKAMLTESKAKKAKEAKEVMLAEVVQMFSDEDDDEDPTASTFTRSRALIASTSIPHAASTAPRYVLALFVPNASPHSATRKRKST